MKSGRIAALALLAAAASVPADAGPRSVWDRAAEPDKKQAGYRAQMARGDQLVERAAEQVNLGETRNGQANQLALRAAEAYEKAAALRPKAAEPHYRAAEVLSAHFIEEPDHLIGDLVKPAQRAIGHWDAFQRLAPRDSRLSGIGSVRSMGVLFRRSIALTKLGGIANFKRAAADYDAALRLSDSASADPQDTALLLSNAAEIHMAAGDLERAIELYSDSLEFNPKPLYGYGLIVALDRDGQATKALEMMQSYGYKHEVLFPDPRHEAPPFFVPDGDVHWYQSIGEESKGNFQSALNHMNQFLSFQPKSPYVARAKERIKTLEVKLRRSKGKKPPPVDPDAYMKTWELPPAELEKLKRDKKKPRKRGK